MSTTNTPSNSAANDAAAKHGEKRIAKSFTLFGHEYTMRDPSAYGTDAIVQEARKSYYLTKHPEDRDAMRSEFREHYAAWLDSIEDSATDNVLLLAAVLIPVGTAPTLVPDDMLAMRSWDMSDAIEEPLRFFQTARQEAYLDYLRSKGPGESSTMESTAPTTTNSIDPNETITPTDSVPAASTAPATDPTTENTFQSNTKNE